MEQVDEEGFHLVEQKTPAKPKWGPGARGGRGGGRGGFGRGGFGGRGGWQDRDAQTRDGQSVAKNPSQQPQRSRWKSNFGRGGFGGAPHWRDKPARTRISSVLFLSSPAHSSSPRPMMVFLDIHCQNLRESHRMRALQC